MNGTKISKRIKPKKKVKVFEEPSEPDDSAQVINFSRPMKSQMKSI